MTEDVSRLLRDPRMRYATALGQQGRVLTESDWNEMVWLESEDRRQTILETVCTEGSSNDGFRVGPVAPFGARIFSDPPAAIPFPSYEFPLGGGSFYLGGHRFSIDTGAETFQSQSDWLTLTLGTGRVPPAPAAARTDLVYLCGWEESVTSTEDQEFRERALGGPDTAVRVRRMRRVMVLPDVAATDCAAARAELRTFLAQPDPNDPGVPHGFDSTGTELLSKARLTVSFPDGGVDADPCKPRQVRGFLGAENQAIRVQLTAANQFVWGIDNAAPIYRVQVDPADPTRLVFLTTPHDRASMPLMGQAVEILPWDAVLANGEKAAASTGFISGIAKTYDPDDNSLQLAAAVPQPMLDWLANLPAALESGRDLPGERRFFYLRVWTGGLPQAFVPGTAVPLPDTGLDLRFSDRGLPGDYWVIAARPNTPELVVPWRLLDQAPPTGPRLFFTALALVRWDAALVATVQDCRERFRSLCRNNGCCQFIVGDGHTSHGDFTSIQRAIEELPPEGGEVCVLRGRYAEAVEILSRENVVLHGCGPDTVIVPPAGAAAGIAIDGCQTISVRNLAIEAPAALGVVVTGARNLSITLSSLRILARDRSAILAKVRRGLVVENCALSADRLAADHAPDSTAGLEPLLYAAGDELLIEKNLIIGSRLKRDFRFLVRDDRRIELERALLASSGTRRTAVGGLQIGGGSSQVEVRRNLIAFGNGNGITLGSIGFVTDADAGRPVAMARVDGSFGRAVLARRGFRFDPNGCIFIDGDPIDPVDPAGNPLVPTSEGNLDHVRIIDNRIVDMGQNGIAVARLFFPDAHPDLITIRRLWILENLIEDCMGLEVGPISPANVSRVAFGGIVLAEVELATLRGNVIEGVGTRHRDSICGIFVLSAIGLAIEDNRLRDNGRVAERDQPLKRGNRGAIVIRSARVPAERSGFEIRRLDKRRDGMPAVVVHGNVAVAREGRALSLIALGPVSITDNQFTAHGSDFLALLGVLLSSIVGGRLAPASRLAAASRLAGDRALFDLLLDALGGTAVLVVDLGWSRELPDKLLARLPGAPSPGSSRFTGGNVLFADNQVVYDALDPIFSVSLCAVLLLSPDSVTMADNQVDCDLAEDFVLIDTIVAAWSVQVTGNRFKEKTGQAHLSAFTAGFLNVTGLNVGTHCIVDKGFKPAAIVRPPSADKVDLHLNVVLLDVDGDDVDCRALSDLLPPRIISDGKSKVVDTLQERRLAIMARRVT